MWGRVYNITIGDVFVGPCILEGNLIREKYLDILQRKLCQLIDNFTQHLNRQDKS